MIAIGIEDIHFATGSYVLDLSDLAEDLGVDVQKYHVGLGQEMMSVPADDEDIVTLAAQAAAPLLERYSRKCFRTLLFATETGLDQSKAAGIYVHRLLGMDHACRVVELKQACYSATAALQLACGYVRAHLSEKVLVIASDIARYEARSNAEATQGCGAVAFVVGNNPKILRIDEPCGLYTEDVMDFWRPNHLQTALVDGKYSARIYLQALRACWNDLKERFDLEINQIQRFCYHLPFTRLAVKAHQQMTLEFLKERSASLELERLEPTLVYSRQVGNCYSASVYLGILSLLENSKEDLSNERLAVFSYGSGCVAEVFTATIMPGYEKWLRNDQLNKKLLERQPVSVERYRELIYASAPTDGSSIQYPRATHGAFRLSAVADHKRLYEICQPV